MVKKPTQSVAAPNSARARAQAGCWLQPTASADGACAGRGAIRRLLGGLGTAFWVHIIKRARVTEPLEPGRMGGSGYGVGRETG